MVIDAGLIAKDLGISRGFVLKWITIIQKEMGLKSI
jgi:hypothetical protein